MPETPSINISLGKEAPDFQLPDTISGHELSLQELKGNMATVIMFICNHCPYVKHVNPELIKVNKDFAFRGVNFIAINSNDITQQPDDAPDKMKVEAARLGYHFPYLYDATQEVAKAFGAACTPEFFVYDRHLRLVYHGQLDDSRPGSNIPLTGKDLRDALNALLELKPALTNQKPSTGCGIKWKV